MTSEEKLEFLKNAGVTVLGDFVLEKTVERLLFVILRLKKEDCYNPYGEATLYDTANIG